MSSIGGSLIHKLFQVDTDSNGNISVASIQRLESLKTATEHLIVLIYDEIDLPILFKSVRFYFSRLGSFIVPF